MLDEEWIHLLTERSFLQEMLEETDSDAWISRRGYESRLREVEARLAEMPEGDHEG